MGHIRMNAYWSKFSVLLAIIIICASGCLETPVKTKAINPSQVLDIEGKEDWVTLLEEYPLSRGIAYYKNTGYGVTKVTFEYMYNSGTGTILHKKDDIDYTNKSRSDYYISGIRLLLKKESGDVYDTGMILFHKDESMAKAISLPKEKFVEFRIKDIEISPRN